jgi:hypothetical protein
MLYEFFLPFSRRCSDEDGQLYHRSVLRTFFRLLPTVSVFRFISSITLNFLPIRMPLHVQSTAESSAAGIPCTNIQKYHDTYTYDPNPTKVLQV